MMANNSLPVLCCPFCKSLLRLGRGRINCPKCRWSHDLEMMRYSRMVSVLLLHSSRHNIIRAIELEGMRELVAAAIRRGLSVLTLDISIDTDGHGGLRVGTTAGCMPMLEQARYSEIDLAAALDAGHSTGDEETP